MKPQPPTGIVAPGPARPSIAPKPNTGLAGTVEDPGGPPGFDRVVTRGGLLPPNDRAPPLATRLRWRGSELSRHANAPREPSTLDCRVYQGNACYTECVVEKGDLPLSVNRRPLYAPAVHQNPPMPEEAVRTGNPNLCRQPGEVDDPGRNHRPVRPGRRSDLG